MMSRHRRLPWVALGLFLVTMSVLGFGLWSVRQAERSPALVARRDIAAGAVIERDDLHLVAVGADAGLSLLGPSEEDLVVGHAARGPVPAGTPLSVALVVGPDDAVPAGSAVVGAILEAGAYPTQSLRAGDQVRLVETVVAQPGETSDAVGIGEASVWAVEPLAGSSRHEVFVSLLVAGADADAVANAASAERLRLVLVGAVS